MEGYQWGEGRMEETGTWNKRHNGWAQNRWGRRLRIVYEMEKPKNLYVRLMDMS